MPFKAIKHRLPFIAASLLFTFLPGSIRGNELERIRRVLILYEAGTAYPGMNLLDQGIRAALDTSVQKLEVYREYMDGFLFPDAADQKRIREFLVRKYQDRRPDVIISVGPTPLQFMVEMRDRGFPGVPVVFCRPTWLTALRAVPSDFTGVEDKLAASETIQAALRLQPGTRHMVLVGGTASIDTQVERVIEVQLKSYEKDLDVSYLTNLAMSDLLDQLRRLPNHTIVFLAALSQDAAGIKFIPGSESAPAVVAASNAPVFSFVESLFNHGEVGGKVFSQHEIGRLAGSLALRILGGEKPTDVARVNAPTVYQFDWRALKRWGLNEKNLPAGSIVINRPPGFWHQYWPYILIGISVFLAELLAILGLLWHRARKKQIEAKLRWRLELEGLLSELSTAFINLPEDQIGKNIEQSLGRVGKFLKVDRISLFEFSGDDITLRPIFSWSFDKTIAPPLSVNTVDLPWWRERLARGETAVASDGTDLPADAFAEREYFLQRGIVSAVSIPLKVNGQVTGAMSYVTKKRRMQWTPDLVRQLQVIGEIFWNALLRKRAMAHVRESEERFRLVANTAPVMIWMSGPDKQCTYFNQLWQEFTGKSEGDLLSRLAELVHPEDYPKAFEVYSKAFDQRRPFKKECRLLRHDGQYRWVLDIGEPRFHADGSFAGYIGSAVDISDQKQAEEALSSVNRRLVEVQEEERSRLARELHDDLAQRVVLLAASVDLLNQDSPPSNGQARRHVEEVQKEIQGIVVDINSLARQLHSSRLEYMGLEAASADFCRELGERQNVEIAFHSEGVPRDLAKELALCLFRVLQEALQNGVKHSGSKHFEVSLRSGANQLELTVRDSGIGFDAQKAFTGNGLGLTSMKERLKLVGGELFIDSTLKQGTTIHAWIALHPGIREIPSVSLGR